MYLIILGVFMVLLQLYKWYSIDGSYYVLAIDLVLASAIFFASNLVVVVLISLVIFAQVALASYRSSDGGENGKKVANKWQNLMVWRDSCDPQMY